MSENIPLSSSQNAFSVAVQAVVEELESADLSRIAQARETLRKLDRRDVLAEIKTNMFNEDPEIRSLASELLLLLNEESEANEVISLLSDPVDFVRYNLIYYIIDYKYFPKIIVEPLINTLLRDPDSEVRILSAIALGRIGDLRAVPALQKAKDNDFATDYEGETVSNVATKAIKEILDKKGGNI